MKTQRDRGRWPWSGGSPKPTGTVDRSGIGTRRRHLSGPSTTSQLVTAWTAATFGAQAASGEERPLWAAAVAEVEVALAARCVAGDVMAIAFMARHPASVEADDAYPTARAS